MTPARRALALEVGIYAARLKRGAGLTQAVRGELVELLLRVAVALLGREPPARLDADPAVLVALSVQTAREAGMDALTLQSVFNDAAERSIRPAALTTGSR